MLGLLYTGYPRSRLPDQLQAHAITRSIPLALAAVSRLLTRTPFHSRLNRCAVAYFDYEVARCLRRHDVLVGLSGQSLRSFRRAVQLGSKTVCERGSSHILFQDQILKEEHDLWGFHYRPIDRQVIDQELQEYELCDRIAVPSSFAERTFVERGIPQAKMIRNPYGVNLDIFRPWPKRDSRFRILFVGNVSLQKGIGYLLRAMALLRRLDCDLWLIGPTSPTMLQFVNNFILTNNLDQTVKLIGTVPYASLPDYYSQASVFVLPSVQEGLALVQAQAMACGLPVIATTNTGAAELFENGQEGFIIPIRSPEAIAECIETLATSPDLFNHMRALCLQRVHSTGGWENYGKRAIAHYCQLAGAA